MATASTLVLHRNSQTKWMKGQRSVMIRVSGTKLKWNKVTCYNQNKFTFDWSTHRALVSQHAYLYTRRNLELRLFSLISSLQKKNTKVNLTSKTRIIRTCCAMQFIRQVQTVEDVVTSDGMRQTSIVVTQPTAGITRRVARVAHLSNNEKQQNPFDSRRNEVHKRTQQILHYIISIKAKVDGQKNSCLIKLHFSIGLPPSGTAEGTSLYIGLL